VDGWHVARGYDLSGWDWSFRAHFLEKQKQCFTQYLLFDVGHRIYLTFPLFNTGHSLVKRVNRMSTAVVKVDDSTDYVNILRDICAQAKTIGTTKKSPTPHASITPCLLKHIFNLFVIVDGCDGLSFSLVHRGMDWPLRSTTRRWPIGDSPYAPLPHCRLSAGTGIPPPPPSSCAATRRGDTLT
jgi:hypothetical protein